MATEEDTMTEALAYWCEQTLNDADSDQAAEARETVAGRPGAENLLTVAAELFYDQPDTLSGAELDEFDYLRIVIAVDENGLLNGSAAKLADHLAGAYATHGDAARGALDFLGEGEYSPKYVDRERLTDDEIDEIRVWAMNTPPGIDMIELGDGAWLLYNHNG